MQQISYIFPIDSTLLNSSLGRYNIRRVIDSVSSQSVPFWELILIANSKEIRKVSEIIDSFVRSGKLGVDIKDQNIHFIEASSKGIIVEVNTAVKSAVCDWVAILDRDTILAAHATYELLKVCIKNKNAIMIYADHDQIDRCGIRDNPFFKPKLSIDLIYCQNYIGSFFAIKKNLFSRFNFSLSKTLSLYTFEIILNVIQYAKKNRRILNKNKSIHDAIVHIPSILHHQLSVTKKNTSDQRINRKLEIDIKRQSKDYLQALRRHFANVSPETRVEEIKPLLYRHIWPIPTISPLVSLIIPTKDNLEILRDCINSILSKTTYKNYEIIIVDNQSQEIEVHEYLQKLVFQNKNIKVVNYNKSFNYSEINNLAVEQAAGEVIGFLNNDVEVISAEWLTEMISHAIRPDVGCVGAMHFYPDGAIQHAGVIVGLLGVADHAFRSLKISEQSDYHNYLQSIRNPDAVTGATLLIRRSIFTRVGGFDNDHLAVAFNDVDLCLKVGALGYRCLWTPYAELFHHESKTRKHDKSHESVRREAYEHLVMKTRWGTHKYPRRELLRYLT